jgi:hypothetical protein
MAGGLVEEVTRATCSSKAAQGVCDSVEANNITNPTEGELCVEVILTRLSGPAGRVLKPRFAA